MKIKLTKEQRIVQHRLMNLGQSRDAARNHVMTPEQRTLRANQRNKTKTERRNQQSTWARQDYAKNPKKYFHRSNMWRRTHPAAVRRIEFMGKFGITLEEKAALLVQQGGHCGACSNTNPGSKRGWSLDHCHATGKVRGVLCHSCNLALGHCKDNPNRLRQLLAYLEKFQ